MTNIKKYLESIVGRRVLVVGDRIVDHYIWCQKNDRGILEVVRDQQVAGGAWNVENNVDSLGGVSLAPELLLTLPTKNRVMDGTSCVARWDKEWAGPVRADVEDRLLSFVLATSFDAMVISDYAKGVCTPRVCQEVIRVARKSNAPIVVDPKGRDWEKFRGATVIKPSFDEESMTVGCMEAGIAVLVTRGASGMTLVQRGQPTWYHKAVSRNPVDPTGAGDTVVAILALALAADATIEEAASLASWGAAVVVGKPGTATVTTDEILALEREIAEVI